MKEWEKNSFKHALAGFGALVMAACALAAALVIYVDPFFHYHAPLKGFPYLVDNQLSQNPGMASHMEYDSVILGSSMTVNFQTTWFQELMPIPKTRQILWILSLKVITTKGIKG